MQIINTATVQVINGTTQLKDWFVKNLVSSQCTIKLAKHERKDRTKEDRAGVNLNLIWKETRQAEHEYMNINPLIAF